MLTDLIPAVRGSPMALRISGTTPVLSHPVTMAVFSCITMMNMGGWATVVVWGRTRRGVQCVSYLLRVVNCDRLISGLLMIICSMKSGYSII